MKPVTKTEAVRVLEELSKLLYQEPYFKSVELGSDDGGLHVELRVDRSALPASGPPHIGSVDNVRVCVMVVG